VSFPLASPTRFSSSARKPGLESRSLYTGHHTDSKQVPSMPLSRSREETPVLMSPKVLSMRRREFTCARLSSPYMTRSKPRLFHNVHHRDLAIEAAYGCLKPPPAGRLRRANLHLPYSMALACLLDTTSPFTSGNWFLQFRAKACVQLAPPIRRPPSAQSSGSPRTYLRRKKRP
jgi:hypothetical protein